jgi:hypothetical protein
MGQDETQDGLTQSDLKVLADWAHLHPMDQVSVDGKHWIHVHEFKELGMFWYILSEGQAVYGPTSVGTLKEFFIKGEITASQPLRHARTREEKTLEEVIGSDYVHKATNGTHPPVPDA